jgi:hypothetical protein
MRLLRALFFLSHLRNRGDQHLPLLVLALDLDDSELFPVVLLQGGEDRGFERRVRGDDGADVGEDVVDCSSAARGARC